MNERIRELYQQAHLVREYPEDDPMRGGNPPTVYWGGERSAERFAELLIKECAKKANAIALDIRLNSKLDARKYVGDSILKSFGVEE